MAADQGDEMAQFCLGTHYRDGDGVPKDNIAAHMWLSLAEGSGEPQIMNELGNQKKELEAHMTREEIAKAQQLARDWQPMPAGEFE